MNLILWSIKNIGLRRLFWTILFIVYANLAGYFSYPQPPLKPDPVYDWFVRKLSHESINKRFRGLPERDSARFLAVTVIVSLLMLGLSFISGPDPRIKIYILAEEETADALSTLIRSNVSDRLVFFTSKDEFNDLDILIRTGTIRVILIADFPDIFEYEEQFQQFLAKVLIRAERLIVVESYQDCVFASKVLAGLPRATRIMSELEISDEIKNMVRGTGRSYSLYELFTKAIAVSSLVLVGAGAALCSSRILESGSDNWLRGVVEGILISSSIFVFIQAIYLICSRIIEMPISLHSTNAKITAMSLIGPFGGGSAPRILFAVAGLTLGTMSVAGRKNMKFSPRRTAWIIALGVFFLMTVGLRRFGKSDIFGALLLRFGYAFYCLLRISGPVFSRGIMMLFPGLLPLGLVPRMKNELRSTIIPVCILVGGWALMRVGEMRLESTLWSFPPGIILGILLTSILLLVNNLSLRNVCTHKRD